MRKQHCCCLIWVFDVGVKVVVEIDSHLIVVAIGENFDLSTGFGSSAQANNRPVAYNNPIFVDVDGGGFTANGDTLGFDLPTKKISVDRAREQLKAKGLEHLMGE